MFLIKAENSAIACPGIHKERNDCGGMEYETCIDIYITATTPQRTYMYQA
jgi:hypothetical protein